MTVTVRLTLTDAGRTYVAGGQTRTREVEVRVFAPDKPGEYPVVFWGHGFGASPSGSASTLPRLWADQGYIVVVPTHLDSMDTILRPTTGAASQATLHRLADMRFLLDSFGSLTSTLNAAHPGYTGNLANVIAAGHSQGAFVASLLTGAVSGRPELAGAADPRFTAAVLVSPQGAVGADSLFGFYHSSDTDHSWTGVLVPTLTVTGTDDNGTDNQTFEDRLDGFQYAPGVNKHALVIRGANHVELSSGIDPAVIQEVLTATVTFANAYVRGDAAALAKLLDTTAYSGAHPLVSEIYARAGGIEAGTLRGTAAADQLSGLQTRDRIEGLGGDDRLEGGAGEDFLDGGPGRDTLNGGLGADHLIGGTDADELRGDHGDDLIGGQDGDDFIDGGDGRDVLYGDGGSDHMVGGAGADALHGQGGDDLIGGHDGDDFIDGGAGVDTLYGDAGADHIIGGSDNDALHGQDGNDLMGGQDGNDLLVGGSGDDVLYGDADDDTFAGQAGNDRLDGGVGLDTAIFSGLRSAYVITAVDGGFMVAGPDGVDALFGIERLVFDDGAFVL